MLHARLSSAAAVLAGLALLGYPRVSRGGVEASLAAEGSDGATARRVEALIGAHPTVARGRIGFLVEDVESGVVVAEQNSAQFFTPASNAKLFTTAAALARLGPGYRFRTVVEAGVGWHPGDTTVNELRLVGGGDPNLSGRALPYSKSAIDGLPLSRIEQLADQVVDAGIRVVTGDVVAVDRRYRADAYPDGWTIDDHLWDYGAPVSSLCVNDNSIQLVVTPTETGRLASVALVPEVAHYWVLNQVVTVAGHKDRIEIARDPGSDELVVRGEIGREVHRHTEELAVRDAALFAAQALTAALRQRGIAILGGARGEALEAGFPAALGTEGAWGASQPASGAVVQVASLESAPLADIVAVVNKVSQNLHAEMLLRELGFVKAGVGTLAAGVAERQAFLMEAGVTEKESGYVLEDGSGLARQDLITPRSTVTLLRYMWHRTEREAWLASLPIGGTDGSLEHRMSKVSHPERIHAKTGSLSHVFALAGYAEAKPGKWLAFSIVLNGETAPGEEVREFVDQFCAALLGEQH